MTTVINLDEILQFTRSAVQTMLINRLINVVAG